MAKRRIAYFVERAQLLDPFQSGFRSGRSTADNTGMLTLSVLQGFNEKKFTAAFFADVQGAYDNDNPQELILKLSQMNFPSSTIKFIAQPLFQRKIFTTYNGKILGPRTTSRGLPQGDIMSPLLYTADVSRIFQPEIQVLQYADDICLMAQGKDLLQTIQRIETAANLLSDNMESRGIPLSPAKSQLIMFIRRNNQPQAAQIHVKGAPVLETKNAKFLGLLYDKKLNWKAHIDIICQKAKKRAKFIKSLINFRWGAHPQSLLNLYKSLIRPVFEYNAGIYDPRTQENWHKIEVIQNDARRTAMGCLKSTPIPSLMAESGELPIRLRMKTIVQKTILRWAGRSENPVVRMLNRLNVELRFHQTPILLKSLRELPINLDTDIEHSTLAEKYRNPFDFRHIHNMIQIETASLPRLSMTLLILLTRQIQMSNELRINRQTPTTNLERESGEDPT